MRPETGPMKFGDDWTGCFIRGDDAIWSGNRLQEVCTILKSEIFKNFREHFLQLADLEILAEQLRSSREGRNTESIQQLKSFEECKK